MRARLESCFLATEYPSEAGEKCRRCNTHGLVAHEHALVERNRFARNATYLKRPREPPNRPSSLGVCQMRLRMDDRQAQEFLEGIEIAVAMQECVPLLDAERRDQDINRLSHCPASAAQRPIVLGGLDG